MTAVAFVTEPSPTEEDETMTHSESASEQSNQMTLQLRVRYVECDPMNVVHHSAYLPWLELARTEMLRRAGMSYADCEKAGVFFVVARISVRYRKPAHYDDALDIVVKVESAGRLKLDHSYRVLRDGQLLAEAETTLVCVDSNGKPQATPDHILDYHS